MDGNQERSPSINPSKEKQLETKIDFDTKIKALFADVDPRVDEWQVSHGLPTVLQDAESFVTAEDKFTDKWWKRFYRWMDQRDFHQEKYKVARATFDSLDMLPADATLPDYLKWCLIDAANGWLEKETERKETLDALKNPDIPIQLRSQLGKLVAESRVSPHSVDLVMQDYRIFGDEVSTEVKNKIFPLMLAGLAYDKYDTYKEDLIELYKEKPIFSENEPEKKRSIFNRVRDRFKRRSKAVNEEATDKREEAERKVEAIRNLVLRLYPPLSSEDPRMLRRWERIGHYTGVSSGRGDAGFFVSEDLSKLPAEKLEEYTKDLSLLTDLPEFENLSRNVASKGLNERKKGVSAPFVALGRATYGFTIEDDSIPIDSVLQKLNMMSEDGVVNERILDEVLSGMGAISHEDDIKNVIRRNFKILIGQEHLPDRHMMVKNFSILKTDDENSFKTVLKVPNQVSVLMDESMRELKFFVYENASTLLKDDSDLRFLNALIGQFGNKSDQIIRDYKECLSLGAISVSDKDLFLEFARQFKAISPVTISGYKEAKERGHEKVYIADLSTLAEKLISSSEITDEERQKPYYKDVLRHVYPNNGGNWTSYENNDSCRDRGSDLEGYEFKPRYDIDLLSQSEIRVKAGMELDPEIQQEVQKPIFEISNKMSESGYDYEKIKNDLNREIKDVFEQIVEKGGLSGLRKDEITMTEERLFLILADSVYGSKGADIESVKNLLIAYEFANFEDISDYIAGTRDRVGRANNQDYALLCEVGSFYSDRIKEVNRKLVESAWDNSAISDIMPEYFRKLSQESVTAQRADQINRLRVERLGESESFVQQVGKILETRNGRKYEPSEVKEIIRRYEGITGGLTERTSTSKKPQTRAFYGQLRSQRERTFEALKVITGEDIDPKTVHLGEINLQEALQIEANIIEGKYDEEQFASYTTQKFIDIFEDEHEKIQGELNKFESISGKEREVLHGYITKSKESANARMVGGVCVAGDNPAKSPDRNMWDMPNYFQFVFQEPDTLQCQGLVLLHSFTQGGKKILSASINPSSTYTYSVDEAALFNGIMNKLEQFASDNGFDSIVQSKNKTIRTNRVGGQFEKAMDERVSQVDKKFTFDAPQQFSYDPYYQLQEMDVVWEKK